MFFRVGEVPASPAPSPTPSTSTRGSRCIKTRLKTPSSPPPFLLPWATRARDASKHVLRPPPFHPPLTSNRGSRHILMCLETLSLPSTLFWWATEAKDTFWCVLRPFPSSPLLRWATEAFLNLNKAWDASQALFFLSFFSLFITGPKTCLGHFLLLLLYILPPQWPGTHLGPLYFFFYITRAWSRVQTTKPCFTIWTLGSRRISSPW